MADRDPNLPPAGDPDPAPARSRRITCDFCGCSLIQTGDMVEMSAKAKRMRDQGVELETKTARVEELERALSTLKAELEALKRGGNPGVKRLVDQLNELEL